MEPHLGARRPPETVRRRRRAPLFDTRRRPRPQGRRNSNRRSKGVRHGADACTRGDGTDAASADIDDDRVREGARVLSMGAARAHEGNGRSAVKRRCEEKVFRLVMRAAAYRRASTAALRTAAHCCALLRTVAHCCALLRSALLHFPASLRHSSTPLPPRMHALVALTGVPFEELHHRDEAAAAQVSLRRQRLQTLSTTCSSRAAPRRLRLAAGHPALACRPPRVAKRGLTRAPTKLSAGGPPCMAAVGRAPRCAMG